MAVTALCMETGAFGETFAYELATALGVQVLDLQALEFSIAEWHLFSNDAAERGDSQGRSSRPQYTPAEIEERSVRIVTKLVEAANGDSLVVGWSAAAVLAPLCRVTRICIRAPRPQGAWDVMRNIRYGITSLALGSAEGRGSYANSMNGVSDPKWLNPDDFDLILDSGRKSAAECQREIVALVERRRHHRTGGERERDTRQDLRRCAATVGTDDVPLTGIESQEAAIARIEQHLHGVNQMSAPANPLCRRASD